MYFILISEEEKRQNGENMHKGQGRRKKEFAPAERQQDGHRGQEFMCCSLCTKMPLRGIKVPVSPGQDSILRECVETPSKRPVNDTYYDGSYLHILI